MDNNNWKMYDELIAGLPEEPVIEECVIGTVWTFVKAGPYCGVALTVKETSRPLMHAGTNIGRRLKDAASGVKSWNFIEASVGMASINAFYNTPEHMRELGVSGFEGNLAGMGEAERIEDNVFDNPARHMKGARVAVIGHFPNIEKQLGDICELSILERSPSKGDFPDSACEFILPEQDFVFITGMTLINKTLPRLLQICSGGPRVSVVGPSTAVSPVLFGYGVDNISGYCVTDPGFVRLSIGQAERGGLFSGGRMMSYSRPRG